jgi:nucleoside-diphosphate-sugar epimerase
MMDNQIVVTGASSMIGQPLTHLLREQGLNIYEVSRKDKLHDRSVISWDMTQQSLKSTLLFERLISEKESTLIHCAPIWFLAKHVPDLAASGVKRIIAFSSSSIEGKSSSSSVNEQKVVELLRQAEEQVTTYSRQGGIQLTIFRPTMIYGHGQGQNLAFIAKFIQRFGVFPIVTHAQGLRQPVHIDDLVSAAYLTLNKAESFGKTYNLSGGESLSYEMMIGRVFDVLGKKKCIPQLPLPIYRQALRALAHSAKLAGKTLPIDPSMADRMREDLSFDNYSAIKDFSFQPSMFLPNGKEDLLS